MAGSHFGFLKTSSGIGRIAHTLYGYCPTFANNAEKVVSLYTGTGNTVDDTWDAIDLIHGLTITVRFSYGNTASNPTLNVNGTGAKPMCKFGTTRATTWSEGAVISFTYDTTLNSGGAWIMNDYQEGALDAYPVGSVYITSTNNAPTIGGTWELVDAQFQDMYVESVGPDPFVVFLTHANASQEEQHVYQQLSGHTWYIRAVLTLVGSLDDNECELFKFIRIPGTLGQNVAVTLFNDTANGYAYGGLKTDGTMRTLEVMTRSGSSVSGSMTGGHLYMNMAIPFSVKQSYMLNSMDLSYCNKFYWKRIS